jgi:hypothetical protein
MQTSPLSKAGCSPRFYLATFFVTKKVGRIAVYCSPSTATDARLTTGLQKVQKTLDELRKQPKRTRYGLPHKATKSMIHAFENELERRKKELDQVHSAWEAWGWAQRDVFGAWRRYEASKAPTAVGSSPTLPSPDLAFGPGVYSHIIDYLITTFRDRFRSPSLALALFAQASTLSIGSYVSGCTTPVYNEVLRTRWLSMGDVVGFTEVLREMQAAGVGMDEVTYRLIGDVANFVAKHQSTARMLALEEYEGDPAGDAVSQDLGAPEDEAARAIADEAASLSIEMSPDALSTSSPALEALVDSRTFFSEDDLVAVREADEIAQAHKHAIKRLKQSRAHHLRYFTTPRQESVGGRRSFSTSSASARTPPVRAKEPVPLVLPNFRRDRPSSGARRDHFDFKAVPPHAVEDRDASLISRLEMRVRERREEGSFVDRFARTRLDKAAVPPLPHETDGVRLPPKQRSRPENRAKKASRPAEPIEFDLSLYDVESLDDTSADDASQSMSQTARDCPPFFSSNPAARRLAVDLNRSARSDDEARPLRKTEQRPSGETLIDLDEKSPEQQLAPTPEPDRVEEPPHLAPLSRAKAKRAALYLNRKRESLMRDSLEEEEEPRDSRRPPPSGKPTSPPLSSLKRSRESLLRGGQVADVSPEEYDEDLAMEDIPTREPAPARGESDGSEDVRYESITGRLANFPLFVDTGRRVPVKWKEMAAMTYNMPYHPDIHKVIELAACRERSAHCIAPDSTSGTYQGGEESVGYAGSENGVEKGRARRVHWQ